MAKDRIPFTTSLEREVILSFKENCKKNKININDAIELLMECYNNKKIEFKREVVIK